MSAAGNNSEQQTKVSEIEETLSFLNSLPEVKKPMPKRSVREEHLDFLNSLPQVPVSRAKAVASDQSESALSRIEKEELQVQSLREESIRLEQDAELAKLLEQQETEELEKRIAMELEESGANQSGYLNSKSKADASEKVSAR